MTPLYLNHWQKKPCRLSSGIMPEYYQVKIVTILTFGFALASLFGYLSRLARLSPLLGYLLAGYLIGPYSPGIVADEKVAEQLAEIGVILMMFGVGMHFKWEDLVSVKAVAIPGAVLQTLASAVAGLFLVLHMGWNWEAGVVVGVAVGVASTVVLVRVLSDNNLLGTPQGHIAVGWLIVEDILTVFALLLLPTMAKHASGEVVSATGIAGTVVFVLLKFIVLAGLIFTIGRKFVIFSLMKVARTRSHELMTLTVLALTFVIAEGSAYLFGTSIALGAFIAGMVIGRTEVRHQVAANALPLRDAFVVVFFLSVGMIFNPMAIATDTGLFFSILAIVILLKPLVAFVLVLFLKHPLKTALTVAIGLAQIGEFSFILAEEALKYRLLPDTGYDLIVACALVSIALNPLMFKCVNPISRFFERRFFALARKDKAEAYASQITPRAIVVGFGPVGQGVVETLEKIGYQTIIIDLNVDVVSKLALDKREGLYGDAATPSVLEQAHIESASLLVITSPDTPTAIGTINAARQFNPKIPIIARVRYTGDQEQLVKMNVKIVCSEVEEKKAFELALERMPALGAAQMIT